MKNEEKEAKLFDPKELTRDAKRIRTVEYADGSIIRYNAYSLNMAKKVAEIPNSPDRAAQLVFLMMENANPGLTLEDVCSWPAEKFKKILEKLADVAGLAPGPPGKVSE